MSTTTSIRGFIRPLALLVMSFSIVEATVFLPEYNRSYTSMPALFGGKWSEETPVTAHLQIFPNRPLMCRTEVEGDSEEADFEIDNDSDLPVALLIQRGECTFYEKATEASKYVDYVIIYDNEISPQLVPMSSESASNMSLLFVSFDSGKGKFQQLAFSLVADKWTKNRPISFVETLE